MPNEYVVLIRSTVYFCLKAYREKLSRSSADSRTKIRELWITISIRAIRVVRAVLLLKRVLTRQLSLLLEKASRSGRSSTESSESIERSKNLRERSQSYWIISIVPRAFSTLSQSSRWSRRCEQPDWQQLRLEYRELLPRVI